jgi:hypothetical protein
MERTFLTGSFYLRITNLKFYLALTFYLAFTLYLFTVHVFNIINCLYYLVKSEWYINANMIFLKAAGDLLDLL